MGLPMRSAGLSAVQAGAPSSAGSLRDVVDATQAKAALPCSARSVAGLPELHITQVRNDAPADGEPAQGVEVAAQHGLARASGAQPVGPEQRVHLNTAFRRDEAQWVLIT